MTSLVEILRQEITAQGAIPFIRFMELALYHPQWGYYERTPQVIGKEGDFYTNVSTGALFGELLAGQFAEWMEGLKTPVILETGAHDGRLASDILKAFLNPTSPKVEYWIIEPSPARKAWQQSTLRAFAPHVRWFKDEGELPTGKICGVILAHELLDAFPRHRLGWDARGHLWFEWGVDWINGRFEWVKLPLKSKPESGTGNPVSLAPELPEELLAVLPDGFTTESCPAATHWWERMAKRLESGVILAVDYGLEALDFFQPHRAEGTLRAYYRHHLVADVLQNVGEQDITGMVSFSEIRKAGLSAGLQTIVDDPQSRFLTRRFQQLCQKGQANWPADKVRQFMTLTHEEHLGRAFRLLAQGTPGMPGTQPRQSH